MKIFFTKIFHFFIHRHFPNQLLSLPYFGNLWRSGHSPVVYIPQAPPKKQGLAIALLLIKRETPGSARMVEKHNYRIR